MGSPHPGPVRPWGQKRRKPGRTFGARQASKVRWPHQEQHPTGTNTDKREGGRRADRPTPTGKNTDPHRAPNGGARGRPQHDGSTSRIPRPPRSVPHHPESNPNTHNKKGKNQPNTNPHGQSNTYPHNTGTDNRTPGEPFGGDWQCVRGREWKALHAKIRQMAQALEQLNQQLHHMRPTIRPPPVAVPTAAVRRDDNPWRPLRHAASQAARESIGLSPPSRRHDSSAERE